MRGGDQRCHGQGRHLLPDDSQKTHSAAGNRTAEPPALRVPRRFGRCLPARAGQGLPRSRPFRPNLLQPGQHVRRRPPADRGGDGLLHRRRRLRPGDVGRSDHREEPGHDLPRRPAAGKGRDRRSGDAGRTRWRRRAHPHLRRGGPSRGERRARACARAPHRRQSQSQKDRYARHRRAARAAASCGRTRRRDTAGHAKTLRRARDHRAPG